jgi:phage virion morphogenesis protein
MEVKIEVNTKALNQELSRAKEKLSDLTPLMATLAQTLYTITDESFDAERSPDGTPWANLAPSTWRYKKSGRKLYESSTLRDSLYAHSDKTIAQVGVNASAKGFQYGLSHQFGSTKRHIPARPFFPIDRHGTLMSQAQEELIAQIVEYFKL